MSEARRLAAIMFTDIQGFTKLMHSDEKTALEQLRLHNQTLDELSKHFQGHVVKSIGDSYMMLFSSAVNAVQCAYEAQQRFKQHNALRPDGRRLFVRVSIHLGDVVEREGDLYGDGVNVASRLQGVAPAGGIAVSREVQAQIKGRVPYEVHSLGRRELKGIAEPVEVFAVVTGAEQDFKPAVSSDALVGRQLGPCILEEVIGRGGMGVVYRGRHLALDRPAAVKVLVPGEGFTEAMADKLLAEARLAAAVEDPRVIQIYDAGRQDAVRYVVMQLVQGQTLESAVAASGPLKPERARAVMREVLLGLAAAHKRGLVHRDVKPANVMLDASGGVKLLDFGLAAPAGRAEAAEGGAAGSFDFMPPEQGFDAAPDPRQDLYAFGATWFYCLAGLPPYSGCGAADMLLQHREAPVPDVRAANREVTAQTADLIKRLMDKDPERRPRSAEEVLAAMDSVGMSVDLAPGGSPFEILPPPPEPEPEGVASDPVVQAALRAAPPAPATPRERAFPAPPPPLPAPAHTSAAGWAVLAVVFLWLFGRHWLAVGAADWLGLGAACGVALSGLALTDVGLAARRAISAALLAAMGCAFWSLAGGHLALLSFESLAAGALGAALVLGGAALGFWTQAKDRPLGAGLLLAGALVLAAAALGLSPERAHQAWTTLATTGGIERWTGVALALAGCAISRTSC